MVLYHDLIAPRGVAYPDHCEVRYRSFRYASLLITTFLLSQNHGSCHDTLVIFLYRTSLCRLFVSGPRQQTLPVGQSTLSSC